MHKKHIIGLGILVLVLSTVYLSLLAMQNSVSVGETAKDGTGPANNGNNNLPEGISARLTGHGESAELEMKITIAAVINANKDIAGGVSGQTNVWKNFKAVVVEVVPPLAEKDYWCINAVVRDIPGLENFNNIWFIKDLPSGDLISSTGKIGLTCAFADVPTDASFNLLTKGDFKGDIRN